MRGTIAEQSTIRLQCRCSWLEKLGGECPWTLLVHIHAHHEVISIITLDDQLSKWAEAVPLTKHTAPTVARALMTHVFSRFGAPRQLLSDRGPEFESALFTHMMEWMEIDKLRTTPYKPSTNGVVERFHRTLNSMLGKVVSDSQRDWDEHLPLVMAAYRSSPHSATGYAFGFGDGYMK